MITYYITSHGYGHGVRSCDILNAFMRLYPKVPVTVVSTLPDHYIKHRLIDSDRLSYRTASFDVGMVQLDSIRVDVAASLDAIEGVYEHRTETVAGEVEFLKKTQTRLVIADIPALPFEAAHTCGIPCLAVGNFAWDWIYRPFVEEDSRWISIIDQLQAGYAKADLLLRLPFAEPMEIFPKVEDVPVVASPGRSRREELAVLTDADPSKKWVLLSFSSLDWEREALEKIKRIAGYEFFTVMPLAWEGANFHAVDRRSMTFADVLASCDTVVTKPGFGILSECIVNKKPIIYAERENFVEYPILVDAINRYLKNQHIPAKDLYAGELEGALGAIETNPEPKESAPIGGAEMVAKRMADFYG